MGDAEPLSAHLQTLRAMCSRSQARRPLDDKHPPDLSPEDGPIIAKLNMRYISYYFTERAFVKRQPSKEELGLDIYGDPCVIPYIAYRLRNEAAALQFIASRTTIPVPKFLGLWEQDGLVYLKTAFVGHGIELGELPAADLPEAVRKVSVQLKQDIIPQLQKCTSKDRMGSVDPDLPVIAPSWLWGCKEKRTWPSQRAGSLGYNFCHMELHRDNILVHPETFQIISILDWDLAGYFPAEWEHCYWEIDDRTEITLLCQRAKQREEQYLKDSEPAESAP